MGSWFFTIAKAAELERAEIEKFNPYHDEKGRFASKVSGAGADKNNFKDLRGGVVSAKVRSMSADVQARAVSEEKQVSSDMDRIAQANGGYMQGLGHAIKSQDSLERKIREDSISKGQGYKTSANGIGDALRYTIVYHPEEYTAKVQRSIEDMKAAGYTPVEGKMKNYWGENAIYQGINSNWRTPSGQVFEMQYHTPDSFYTKETLNHKEYENYRDKNTSLEIKGAAEKYMLGTQSRVQRPSGVESIGRQVPGKTRFRDYWPED